MPPDASTQPDRPTVFVSYSHLDEDWKDRVVGHLQVLQLEGVLDLWDDKRIAAGDAWRPEIEVALDRAAVAVLLISKDFLISSFIRETEVPRLLARRQSTGVRVIPVFVRPCAWKAVDWLAAIEGWPKGDRALSELRKAPVEKLLTDLALEIRDLLGQEAVPTSGPGPGSSSLPHLDIGRLAASAELGNHALALTLFGNYLGRAWGGDVRRRKEVDLGKADERLGGHALRVIRAYASWLGEGRELAVLRLLGLFDRPAAEEALAALRARPEIPGLTEPLVELSEEEWRWAVSSLRQHGFLLPADPQQAGALDAHPLVRVYFQEELERERPQAWQEGNLRLYEHEAGRARVSRDAGGDGAALRGGGPRLPGGAAAGGV